jgi:hypothetical protein
VNLDGIQTVAIVVAEEIRVPNFVGQSLDAVEAFIEGLEVSLLTDEVYEPSSRGGEILEHAPSEGESLTSEMSVRLTAVPAEVELTSLDALSSRYVSRQDPLEIDGDVFARGIQSSMTQMFQSNDSYVEYNLSRDFEYFSAVLGYVSTSPTSGTARVEVLADNELLYSAEIGPGDRQELCLPVSGKLRLRMEFKPLTDFAEVGLGSARLSGDPQELEGYEPARRGDNTQTVACPEQ